MAQVTTQSNTIHNARNIKSLIFCHSLYVQVAVCLGGKDNTVISLAVTAQQLGATNLTVETEIANSVVDTTGCTPAPGGDGYKDALVSIALSYSHFSKSLDRCDHSV